MNSMCLGCGWYLLFSVALFISCSFGFAVALGGMFWMVVFSSVVRQLIGRAKQKRSSCGARKLGKKQPKEARKFCVRERNDFFPSKPCRMETVIVPRSQSHTQTTTQTHTKRGQETEKNQTSPPTTVAWFAGKKNQIASSFLNDKQQREQVRICVQNHAKQQQQPLCRLYCGGFGRMVFHQEERPG